MSGNMSADIVSNWSGVCYCFTVRNAIPAAALFTGVQYMSAILTSLKFRRMDAMVIRAMLLGQQNPNQWSSAAVELANCDAMLWRLETAIAFLVPRGR